MQKEERKGKKNENNPYGFFRSAKAAFSGSLLYRPFWFVWHSCPPTCWNFPSIFLSTKSAVLDVFQLKCLFLIYTLSFWNRCCVSLFGWETIWWGEIYYDRYKDVKDLFQEFFPFLVDRLIVKWTRTTKPRSFGEDPNPADFGKLRKPKDFRRWNRIKAER